MLKKYSEFVNEGNRVDGVFGGTGEQMSTHLEKYLEKRKKNKDEEEGDEELQKEIEDDMRNNHDKCVRCGKPFTDCTCETDDYHSTINVYRIPKGKIIKK